ncbi:MAG: RNA polymerase sigma factor, partial [Rickettsiales bacterium]
MEKAEEIRLIKQATQHGDASAFRALIDHHYGTIYKIAFKWCGHKQDAEDIAQEVCIKVARTIGSFKGDSAFTSWLYTITV